MNFMSCSHHLPTVRTLVSSEGKVNKQKFEKTNTHLIFPPYSPILICHLKRIRNSIKKHKHPGEKKLICILLSLITVFVLQKEFREREKEKRGTEYNQFLLVR